MEGERMSRSTLRYVVAAVLALSVAEALAGESYNLAFSTYVGGSDWEHARDVTVDSRGNVYVVGGTASQNFPTTSGAYCRTLSTGGSQAFGPCDVFVAKFGPTGNLIWSTYIGGPNYDRAYAVEVNSAGYVYVAGRAGPGLPVKNAFQPNFDGVDNGSYSNPTALIWFGAAMLVSRHYVVTWLLTTMVTSMFQRAGGTRARFHRPSGSYMLTRRIRRAVNRTAVLSRSRAMGRKFYGPHG